MVHVIREKLSLWPYTPTPRNYVCGGFGPYGRVAAAIFSRGDYPAVVRYSNLEITCEKCKRAYKRAQIAEGILGE